MTTEEQSNTNVKQTENWVENWVKKDLSNPNPASVELSDEQLDSAIDAVLESPEVSAMLENAAADAKSDAVLEAMTKDILSHPKLQLPTYLTNDGGADYLQNLRNDFEEFKKRVEKAFKHAGFKF